MNCEGRGKSANRRQTDERSESRRTRQRKTTPTGPPAGAHNGPYWRAQPAESERLELSAAIWVSWRRSADRPHRATAAPSPAAPAASSRRRGQRRSAPERPHSETHERKIRRKCQRANRWLSDERGAQRRPMNGPTVPALCQIGPASPLHNELIARRNTKNKRERIRQAENAEVSGGTSPTTAPGRERCAQVWFWFVLFLFSL